jgi:predicted component of type VI protein secretion system
MAEYGIGGMEVRGDGSEAILEIAQNRTLMIEKLTDAAPIKPVIVEGLKTVDEVFNHFKPTVSCDFEKEDGSSANETLSFSNLGDFGAKGITNQSSFLKELENEKNEYSKLVKQLKTNKLLKSVVENPENKEAFINALQALIQEIEDAK